MLSSSPTASALWGSPVACVPDADPHHTVAVAVCVAWSGAGSRHGMFCALRPRSAPAGCRRLYTGGPGSKFPSASSLSVSISSAAQRRASSTAGSRPRAASGAQLIGLHPAVLRPPAVPRRLADLLLAEYLHELAALVQEPPAPVYACVASRSCPPSIPSRETRPRTQPGSLHGDPSVSGEMIRQLHSALLALLRAKEEKIDARTPIRLAVSWCSHTFQMIRLIVVALAAPSRPKALTPA